MNIIKYNISDIRWFTVTKAIEEFIEYEFMMEIEVIFGNILGNRLYDQVLTKIFDDMRDL